MPVPPDLDHTWTRVQAELRSAVGDSTYRIWFEPLEPLALGNDGTLVVAAPPPIRSWVADRYARILRSCAAHILGGDVRIDVVARGDDHSPEVPSRATAPRPAHDPEPAAVAFHPKYTFDQYIIGDGNRLAHAAALAVAEMPGQAYNPLFICGPPGLGKTHLLHSVANYVSAYGGGLTVRYTTAETFTNEFVASLHAGDIDAFKADYRRADVLLVDDVQFLQSKARTEEEFFHTFNAVYETGSQLVLTSDRLPRDMDALEERLRERFEAGLVTDVRPPDLATRLTILRKRVDHDGVELGDDALEAIAERISDNVRALEGALIRVVAFGSLTRRPITADLAREVLDGLYPGSRRRPQTVHAIQVSICETFGLSLDELLSSSRTARVSWPRQIAMYLARELTDETLPAIGRQFGDRNHTTVLHACRRTAGRMASEPDVFDLIRSLTQRVQGDGTDRSG
jgi:chromosomal replication initiator protein